MTSQQVWERIFARDPMPLDVHRISSTLHDVFKDFQKERPDHQTLRISSHNLLVVCNQPSDAQGLKADLDELLRQYPGRVVVVVRDAELDQAPQGGLAVYTRRNQLAGELIGLHFPQDGAPLPSLITPLWQDGLPTVMFWRGEPPYGEKWFTTLVESCTRVVLDTGHLTSQSLEEVVAPLKPLWDLIRDPYQTSQAFVDLNWSRLRIWRDWIAGLFDRPDRRQLLGQVDALEIEGWAYPGYFLPSVASLYLGAWLAHQLQWAPTSPLVAVPGGHELRCQEIPIRFYSRTCDEAEMFGRPVRVTFRGHCNGDAFRLSVERDSTDSSTLILATAGAHCGSSGHRLHLDRLNNLALMGHELEIEGRDRVFERTLETLLRFTGVLQEVRA